MIISTCPFLLNVALYVLCQPVCTHRDQGGKASGVRVYDLSPRFLQSTLDYLGHNRGEPLPMLWTMWLQLAPTQGCQELSRTECEACGSSYTPTPVSLQTRCTWCTWAPTERHSSPVEAVLTRNEAALPGLIEILWPCRGHGTINQG